MADSGEPTSPISCARVVTFSVPVSGLGAIKGGRTATPLARLDSARHDGPGAARGRHRKARAAMVFHDAFHRATVVGQPHQKNNNTLTTGPNQPDRATLTLHYTARTQVRLV